MAISEFDKESKRYLGDVEKVGDLAERPIEMFVSGDKETTSLNIRTNDINLAKLTIDKNGIVSEGVLKGKKRIVEYDEELILDFTEANHLVVNIDGDLTIKDIINASEGFTYYVTFIQDSEGGHEILLEDKNSSLDVEEISTVENSITIYKVYVVGDKKYFKLFSGGGEV